MPYPQLNAHYKYQEWKPLLLLRQRTKEQSVKSSTIPMKNQREKMCTFRCFTTTNQYKANWYLNQFCDLFHGLKLWAKRNYSNPFWNYFHIRMWCDSLNFTYFFLRILLPFWQIAPIFHTIEIGTILLWSSSKHSLLRTILLGCFRTFMIDPDICFCIYFELTIGEILWNNSRRHAGCIHNRNKRQRKKNFLFWLYFA